MSTTVNYNGSQIATLTNETKTLNTQGKYLTGNIVITDETTASYTWEEKYDDNAYIVSSSPNYIAINNYSESFGANQTWRVTWGSGGTVYVCETQTDSQGTTYDGYYIGNPGVAGGTDDGSGCPFLAYKRSATQLVFATNQSSGTIHLIIEKRVESSGGGSANLGTKTITANGTYDASSDSLDGYSQVTVNVPSQGSSKNVQIAQGVDRVASTSYVEVSGQSITVAETGTYDVYWTGFRSSTGGTNGSQLYIGSTAYGTAQTTFTNHGQSIKLTGVSLTKNQVVSVRARSRGTNYYMYVGNLTIEQTA